MTTTIEWHPYPDEKPVPGHYLVTLRDDPQVQIWVWQSDLGPPVWGQCVTAWAPCPQPAQRQYRVVHGDYMTYWCDDKAEAEWLFNLMTEMRQQGIHEPELEERLR